MFKPAHRAALHSSAGLRTLLLLLPLLLFGVTVEAQTSATDGTTPSGLAPGAPAGSYSLSGFDQINLFNGNLSASLPLLQVGGRGVARTAMRLSLDTKGWRVERYEDAVTYANIPNPDWWTGLDPGYGPGVLQGRRSGVKTRNCKTNTPPLTDHKVHQYTYTTLTFTASDGTEHELRDQNTMGQPLATTGCVGQPGPSRGTHFVSPHGAGLTFISDSTIHDRIDMDVEALLLPTGYLLMPDGTRYRIVGGKVMWMRDRHGNRIEFAYDGNQRVTLITDSLGRQVTVQYDYADVQPYGTCDRITFSGVGGAQRIIRVSKTSLGNALRAGFALQSPEQLFPELDGGTAPHNPTVASAVWLPDGRKYGLRYNSFGELARVELPTGGAFEYDMVTVVAGLEIYRRVTERRVYKGGATLESRTSYEVAHSQSTDAQPWATTVTVDQSDASGTLLARSKHYFRGSALASLSPLASANRDHVYPAWDEGREYKTEVFDVAGGVAASAPLRREESTFQQRAAVSWWAAWAAQHNLNAAREPDNDSRLVQLVTTLVDTNQVSKKTYSYSADLHNNLTDVYEYDFGAGAPPAHPARHTHTDFLGLNAANNVNYADPASGTGYALTDVHIRGLARARQLYSVNTSNGAETLVAQSETRYDEPAYPLFPYTTVTGWEDPATTARGNPTTSRLWLDTGNTWVETHARFDQLGNLRQSWDARGNLSETSFADSFSDGVNTRNTYAFPTGTTSPVPDPSDQYGSNTALAGSTVYDFSTGRVTSTTDANGGVTAASYADPDTGAIDPLDRLRKVTRPDGGWTRYDYGTAGCGDYVQTRTKLNAAGTLSNAYQCFDGLGRAYRSLTYDPQDASLPWVTTDTQYDALGRAWRVSQPYRSSGAESPVNPSGRWTETAFDGLGRVKRVTTLPDEGEVTTAYSGNQMTVTDQEGKSKRVVTDALGRLTQVVEDPNGLAYVTAYQYDTLGNLRKVNQGGQQRFFMYDSLGRLRRAKHPEQSANASLALGDPVTGNGQWSMAYGYDAGGNVIWRTDARGVTASYAYDALGRNTTTDYSDTAAVNPDVERFYDKATEGIGLPWVSRSSGAAGTLTTVVAYDAMGRPTSQSQQFKTAGGWGTAFTTSRKYDLAGNVLTETYPSQRAVTYTYDAAGRLKSFVGNLGDGVLRTYADQIRYDGASRAEQERYGTATPLYNKSFYNSRGQLAEIRVSTHAITEAGQWRTDYDRGAIINHYSNAAGAWGASGGGPDNDGNLKRQDVYIPNPGGAESLTTQFYDYDALNRLDAAREVRGVDVQWRQDYAYDRWGNRTINAASTSGGVPDKQFTVSTATNRLGVPAGNTGAMQYDAAGNLTNDTYAGAGIRAYDAENRMTSAQDYYGLTSTYAYDASGRRVRRKVGAASEVWQVYGIGGELLAEYADTAPTSSPGKEYGYRGGELLVTAEATVNLALGKAATQSSTYTHATNPVAAKATDGNTDGNFLSASMAHTNSEAQAWWRVDLGSVGQINTIKVWNRSDCCADRLTNFYVLVSDAPFASNDLQTTLAQPGVSAYLTSGQGGRPTSVAVNRTGRYVRVQLAGANYLGLAEVEVLSAPDVRWLVADQLGTPRMVIGQAGTLASVSRRDFLPFGEDLYAGGRTAAQGYAGDTVRQKFTTYERDAETGLDFAEARYYAPAQGRFTAIDPLLASATALRPQSWNRYSYVYNNPLRYTDPSGMIGTYGREFVDRSFALSGFGVYSGIEFGYNRDEAWLDMQRRAAEAEASKSDIPVIPPVDSSLAGSPAYVAAQNNRDYLGDAVIGGTGVDNRFHLGHYGAHALSGRDGGVAVTLPSLAGRVIYWNVQAAATETEPALYTVRVKPDRGDFIVAYEDLTSVNGEIRAGLQSGVTNWNSRVRLDAGDVIGNVQPYAKGDPHNNAKRGLHVQFVIREHYNSWARRVRQGQSGKTLGAKSPISTFINPCGALSPVRCS